MAQFLNLRQLWKQVSRWLIVKLPSSLWFLLLSLLSSRHCEMGEEWCKEIPSWNSDFEHTRALVLERQTSRDLGKVTIDSNNTTKRTFAIILNDSEKQSKAILIKLPLMMQLWQNIWLISLSQTSIIKGIHVCKGQQENCWSLMLQQAWQAICHQHSFNRHDESTSPLTRGSGRKW